MKNRTNAELAILSLLAEQPRHGYDIESVIEARGMREWTEIGFSSIYYLLKKLEQAGLVQSRMEQVGQGPARKVYDVTPAGAKALKAGVIEALSEPQRCYPALQLGLANLPGVPPAEALAALRRYRARLGERLDHVRTRRDAQRPLPDHVEAMFGHSLTLMRAELDWIDDFIHHMEEQRDQD